MFKFEQSNISSFMGDQPRRTAIANAIATKKIAATPKTTLARVGGDTIGMLCLAPLYQNASNPNMTTGFTMTSILPINLIQSALGNITDVLMVSMYDDTPDVANDTSLNFIWGSTQSLIITNASATVDQAQIKAAPFQAIGRFPLADRTMRVVFLPTQRFMDSFTGQTKWIALIVSLVIMLILDTLCVVWYFMLRLRRSRVARAMQQHRFHVLQDSHEKQGAMLVRFMEQERINRTTLDAVSEIIISCTYDGLIVHTNSAFEKHFPKESSATQVYASSLFEGVDAHFFRNQTESQNIQMVAGRYTDNELRTNATVTVRPLFDNEYNPADNEKASYLIVAKTN
jgi:PAS domain-containing protein